MFSAAPEGELKVEHPWGDTLQGGQGCLFAGGGDGERWTAAASDQEVQLPSFLGTSSVAPS